MSDSLLQCEIVSAEEAIFSGQAKMVIVAGEMGDLGITPRHAQLITRMKPGQVRVIREDDEEQFYYVSGGILEVQPKVVTVLADTAVRAADIDEASAIKAKEEAEAALADREADIDYAKAQAKLAESMAQLQALKRLRDQLSR